MEASQFTRDIFKEYYDLDLIVSAIPLKYTNCVSDQCELLNSPCNPNNSKCGSNCSQHHKNIHNLTEQFTNLYDNYIYTLWTDRPSNAYCRETSGIHNELGEVYGFTHNNNQAILIMRSDSAANHTLPIMSITFAHEFAHTLGMPEVYNNENHEVSGKHECIMESVETKKYMIDFYNALNGTEDSSPFCDSCHQTLQSLIGNSN